MSLLDLVDSETFTLRHENTGGPGRHVGDDNDTLLEFGSLAWCNGPA
jgi:hypothetical protein